MEKPRLSTALSPEKVAHEIPKSQLSVRPDCRQKTQFAWIEKEGAVGTCRLKCEIGIANTRIAEDNVRKSGVLEREIEESETHQRGRSAHL
jgi:hypothetical protein